MTRPVPAGAAGSAHPIVARTLNIANVLTVLRLALVPVFLVLLAEHGGHERNWRLAAAGAFVVAGVTDRFDGQLARSRGLVTPFGTMADPIADKALTGAAFIGLSALGDLPWWVSVLVLVREFGVTALRFVVIRHGIIPASRGGKLKTLLQGLALLLYLLPVTGVAASGRAYLMAAAVIVTVVTGFDYVSRAATLRAKRGVTA